MKRVRLENIEIDLKERLRNEEFKRLYEIECAKIAIKERMTYAVPAYLMDKINSGNLTEVIFAMLQRPRRGGIVEDLRGVMIYAIIVSYIEAISGCNRFIRLRWK